MLNFMCQLDRAKGCPDNWYSITFGCAWKILTFELVDGLKIALTNVGGPE